MTPTNPQLTSSDAYQHLEVLPEDARNPTLRRINTHDMNIKSPTEGTEGPTGSAEAVSSMEHMEDDKLKLKVEEQSKLSNTMDKSNLIGNFNESEDDKDDKLSVPNYKSSQKGLNLMRK